MKKLIVIICFILSFNSYAQVEFIGDMKPGSILFIKSDELSNVVFDNQVLPIDKGYTVLGFDRDEAGTHLLKIKLTSGRMILKKIHMPKREYRIQRINNLKQKYVEPPKEVTERIKRESKISREAKKQIGNEKKALYASGFVRPVKGGRLTSVFGSQRILNGKPKNAHNGLDIAAPRGTPVYAMADGKVILAADNFYYSGNYIILDHGQGLNSMYLHLSKKDVIAGDFVKKGQKIGEIGTTGRSTGPHLHWGIQWYGKRIDPAPFLKFKL